MVRWQQYLVRMRAEVAESERIREEYESYADAYRRRAVKAWEEGRAPSTTHSLASARIDGSREWSKSPMAADLSSAGQWAHRRADSYAAAVLAELAALRETRQRL